MKKNRRSSQWIPLLLCIALVISLMPAFVSALPATSMSIKFRIEGISQNLYEQTLVVPYSTPTLTVQAALAYLDTETAGLTITGVATGFISDINGDASGTFGGWDGWSFMVNSIVAPLGIDATLLNDGDTVLLYYGDPWGLNGMQYPQVDSSRIGSGILKFTSQDTSYATGSAVTTTNPVVGATVTWYYDSSSASYTTDANGEIVVLEGQRTVGDHRIQIEKYGTTAVSGKYLPLVLRLSSSAKVTVAAASSSSASSSSATSSSSSSSSASSVSNTSGASGNPPTSDSPMALPVIGSILSLSVIAIVIKRKRQNNAN